MNKTEIGIHPYLVILYTILIVLWVNITIGLLDLLGVLWF